MNDILLADHDPLHDDRDGQLGRRVLCALQSYAAAHGQYLPAHGLVIGDAVLAALRGDSTASLRPGANIDIVVPLHGPNALPAPARGAGMHEEQAIERHPLGAAVRWRDGIFDIAAFAWPPLPLALLNDLDLNCVQVGLDLASGRLHATPAFRRFWRNRQAEIVNLTTPPASLLRYALICELGYGGDSARMIELVGAALAYQQWPFDAPFWTVPAADAALLERYYPVLRDWVSKGRAGQRGELVTLRCRRALPGHTTPPLCGIDPRLLKLHPGTARRMLPLIVAALHQPNLAQQRTAATMIERDGGCSPLMALWQQHGEGFIDCPMGRSRLARIERVIVRRGLRRVLPCTTLSALATWIDSVDSEAARRGQWVYEVLRDQPDVCRAGPALASLLDVQEATLRHPLCVPALPPLVIGAFRFTQLCSQFELIEQARWTRRCVGARAEPELVQQGRLRIVAMRTEGGQPGYTLTLDTGSWRISQLLALERSAVPPAAWRAAVVYLGCTVLGEMIGAGAAVALAHRWPGAAALAGAALAGAALGAAQRCARRLAARFVVPNAASRWRAKLAAGRTQIGLDRPR